MIQVRSKTNSVKIVGSTVVLTHDLELAIKGVYEALLEDGFGKEYSRNYIQEILDTSLNNEEVDGSVLRKRLESVAQSLFEGLMNGAEIIEKENTAAEEKEDLADEHIDPNWKNN